MFISVLENESALRSFFLLSFILKLLIVSFTSSTWKLHTAVQLRLLYAKLHFL